jgi:hypothetical protein
MQHLPEHQQLEHGSLLEFANATGYFIVIEENMNVYIKTEKQVIYMEKM